MNTFIYKSTPILVTPIGFKQLSITTKLMEVLVI